MLRSDASYTEEEAKLLDLCLVIHAEHGGGNNSTFACRVLSSSGTDTYSAIGAAIGSLKGPRHGGANISVVKMLDDMKENIRDYADDDEVANYLRKILKKEAGDRSGLIYGMGHAVYTKSDPRAKILKTNAKSLAIEKGYGEDFRLLDAVERLTPELMSEKRNALTVCANVDLYSGLIYRILSIPPEMFTPLFAVARTAGWCAHRMEEMSTCRKIIRPAYRANLDEIAYLPLNCRKEN
jgi:citrate synthase